MPTENPYLDGTGSFVSTATNAGTVKFASFDDSAVNTGVIAVSATFTGTAVNSGIIGDVFPTQYATFLANNSANWDSTYNTVSDLSATWSSGGGGGGAADLTAISDVSSSWDAAFTFVSLNSSSLVDTNDSRLSDDRTPVAHNHSISEVTGLQTALDGKQASGDYVTLVDGKVPSNQLPSYVDDVIEAASTNDFPATGETSKIYVATGTNKTYRWSGSAYVEISPSPGSTDSVTEGSTNLYFTDTRAVNALQSTVNTLSSALDGKQASGSYATTTTTTALSTAIDGKAATSHTHAISAVTGLQTALDGKQASGSYATTTTTTALSTAIDGKAATSHTHAISSVTGLQTTLDNLSSSIASSSSSSSSSSSTSVKTLTSTTYTLLSSDANNVIRYTSASDTTITIPANVMNVGTQIVFTQIGLGKIITSAGAGVTRLSPNSATKTVGQYAVATILQTSQNEWLLTGDVS